MFKYDFISSSRKSDFLPTFFGMAYLALVASSIVLFKQLDTFNIFGMKLTLSGSVIPYVFLYPLSFIILKIYGLQKVNNMIGSTILSALLFVVMIRIAMVLSVNSTDLSHVFSNPVMMYLAGLIAMPAGLYVSFLTINLLMRLNLSFNFVTLSVSTIAGEIVNTLIVFPLGFHGMYSLEFILKAIVTNVLIFKIIMSIVLSFFAIIIIKIILGHSYGKEKIL